MNMWVVLAAANRVVLNISVAVFDYLLSVCVCVCVCVWWW